MIKLNSVLKNTYTNLKKKYFNSFKTLSANTSFKHNQNLLRLQVELCSTHVLLKHGIFSQLVADYARYECDEPPVHCAANQHGQYYQDVLKQCPWKYVAVTVTLYCYDF